MLINNALTIISIQPTHNVIFIFVMLHRTREDFHSDEEEREEKDYNKKINVELGPL